MKWISKSAWLFSFLFLFGMHRNANAQTIKEVFNSPETPLFYLGVDFTLARAIDAPENTQDIRDRHYPGINSLVVNEPDKFDLAKAFRKGTIDHDLELVGKRNTKINPDSIKSSTTTDYNRLKEEDISKLVKEWDFGGKKGAGLLFVVEGMSKTNKGASIWVTLVDMATNKLLMTERMEGKTAIGFGFRNYWANPLKNVITNIEKNKYKEWKAKYGG